MWPVAGYTWWVDELEIQGKKYISSKRASELTGYAKDYVGQLARAGKIPGTRVGRAWYVEEATILAHANSEKTEQAIILEEPRAVISPLQPRRVISPATLKAIGYGVSRLPETWSPALYFADTADLAPRIQKYEAKKEENDVLSESETRIRLRILENQPPRLAIAGRVRDIPQKAREIRNKRRVESLTLSFGAVAAALGVLLFFSSGLVLSSHMDFNQENGASAANLAMGYEYVRDTLMKFPPFADGVHSLLSFFSIIFESFSDFLNSGWAFILQGTQWLINLV